MRSFRLRLARLGGRLGRFRASERSRLGRIRARFGRLPRLERHIRLSCYQRSDLLADIFRQRSGDQVVGNPDPGLRENRPRRDIGRVLWIEQANLLPEGNILAHQPGLPVHLRAGQLRDLASLLELGDRSIRLLHELGAIGHGIVSFARLSGGTRSRRRHTSSCRRFRTPAWTSMTSRNGRG